MGRIPLVSDSPGVKHQMLPFFSSGLEACMNVDAEFIDYESCRGVSRGDPLLGLAGGRKNLPDPRRRAGKPGAVVARRAGRAIPRTDGRGARSLATDAFRGRFPDPGLLLPATETLPVRGRRDGQAILRRGALPAEAAVFPEQPRQNDPDLRCLDLRPSPIYRLGRTRHSDMVESLPAELACPQAEPARVGLSAYRDRSRRSSLPATGRRRLHSGIGLDAREAAGRRRGISRLERDSSIGPAADGRAQPAAA